MKFQRAADLSSALHARDRGLRLHARARPSVAENGRTVAETAEDATGSSASVRELPKRSGAKAATCRSVAERQSRE